MLKTERSGNFCRITKALTLWQLLRQLGYESMADQLILDRSFLDRLADTADFRSVLPGFETDVVFAGPSASEDHPAAEPFPLPDFCTAGDAKIGWVRDGDRILIADTVGGFVKVLEGREALCFQLEHSGMTAADVEKVWTALTEERN